MKTTPFCCDITSGTEQEKNEFRRLFDLASNKNWQYGTIYYGIDKDGVFDCGREINYVINFMWKIIPLSEGIQILKEMVGEESKEYNESGLLPCPFCGSSELLLFAEPSKDKSITWHKIIHISSIPCGISMIHSDAEQLKKDWNKRQPKP